MDLKEFYKHSKVNFNGRPEEIKEIEGVLNKDIDEVEKILQSTFDKVVLNFRDDEDALKQVGQIAFITPRASIETWEQFVQDYGDNPGIARYVKWVSDAKKQWDYVSDTFRTQGDIGSANFEISSKMMYPDGYCVVPGYQPREDGSWSMPYVIHIILDYRLAIRDEDYMMGVIVHEFAEYTTKYYAVHNHLDEIKKPEDVVTVIKKYTKSGTAGTAEYDEHENIVNMEAKRLGFKKEIDAMLFKVGDVCPHCQEIIKVATHFCKSADRAKFL